MGRPLEHLPALRHRRIAGADQHTEFRHQEPGRQGCLSYFNQRLLEVFLNVVAERFQRRDIQHVRMVVKFTRQGLLEEVIDTGEKGGEGLTGPGRRGDQHIATGLNGRPSLHLHIGRSTDARTKPVSDERVESGERHGTEIVPCRKMKLYRLGRRADIDIRRSRTACNEVARQRGERHNIPVADNYRSSTCARACNCRGAIVL